MDSSPNAQSAPPSFSPSIGIRIFKGLGILLLGLGGLMLIAKVLFPLPKGMGLQYVMHPVFALGGIAIAAIGYWISAFVRPETESRAFWIALISTLAWSSLIFNMP